MSVYDDLIAERDKKYQIVREKSDVYDRTNLADDYRDLIYATLYYSDANLKLEQRYYDDGITSGESLQNAQVMYRNSFKRVQDYTYRQDALNKESQIPKVTIANLPSGEPVGPAQVYIPVQNEPQTQSIKPPSTQASIQSLLPDSLKSIDFSSPIVKYVGVGLALFILFKLLRR